MSIAVKTTEPLKIVKPPRAYPPWLVARFEDDNAPVPERELEKARGEIEPWMTLVARPGKILGAEPIPPAKYVPSPLPVQQLAKMPIKFRVLNVADKPIFGFSIRANEKDLVTDNQGEASMNIYQGHDVTFSTGRESGWGFPNGARRKARMTGMVPMSQIFTVKGPMTVVIYPEAGEYQINGGKTLQQPIVYTTS